MATKAIVGIVDPKTKAVKSVIIWADGYPDTAGETLANHFNSLEKATELIENGNIRSLGATIAATDFCKNNNESWEGCQPETYSSLGAFLDNDSEADYLYIFQDGKWNLNE